MKKEHIYAIVVIAVVLLFVIEPFAIGVLQSNRGGSGGNGTPDAPVVSGNGYAEEYLTIERYEPYLIVSGGNGEMLEAIKAKLIESGAVTYAIPSGKGGEIFSLKSSGLAMQVASELESANATVLATATVSMPSIVKVVGDSGEIEAEGVSFSTQLSPMFGEGESSMARFYAVVEGGQVAGIGDLLFLPSPIGSIIADAELVGNASESSIVEIAWESRNAAAGIAKVAGAEFKPKSYIESGNASEEALQALFSSGTEYIVSVRGNIISVKNDFNNSTLAKEDMAAFGVFPSFPPSVAYFANQSGNGSGNLTAALVRELADAGIDAALVISRKHKARLPEYIEHEGRSYYIGDEIVEFEEEGSIEGGTVSLILDLQVTGSKVTGIQGARQAPAS